MASIARQRHAGHAGRRSPGGRPRVRSPAVTVADVSTSTRIRELEADLEKYPDDRAEILCELATACHEAGDHDRAERLWRELIADEGEGFDGSFARTQLAELYFDLDRSDEAYAELAALRAACRPLDTPYLAADLAAQLLESRGDLAGALEWHNLAVSYLSPEQLAAASAEMGWLSVAGPIVRGRRRVRSKLGLPPDHLDQSMPSDQEIITNPFPAALRQALTGRAAPQTARVLYWPRTELAAAVIRWPGLLDAERSQPAQYFPYLQRKWTDTVAEHGISRVELVPATVDTMAEYADRTGKDVADEETRLSYMEERYEAGHAMSWPPPRNAPCWCGSGTKYKKCCGRPGI